MNKKTEQEIRSFVGNGVKRLVELSVPDGIENPLFESVFADFKSHYIVHCQDQAGIMGVQGPRCSGSAGR